MESIPTGVLAHILSYTEGIDVQNLSLVSKTWNKETQIALSTLFKEYEEKPNLKEYAQEARQIHTDDEISDDAKRIGIIFVKIVKEAKEFGLIENMKGSLDALSSQHLESLAKKIHYQEAMDLNIFFEEVSHSLPLAQTFLKGLDQNLSPIDRARQIREWMQAHKESLSRINSLELKEKELKSLPSEISYLTGLTFLSVQQNLLITLPPEIGNLTQLKTLYLNENKLKELPFQIGKLTQLECLFLTNNHLKGLPKEIGNLTQLKFLQINKNQLETVPKEIGKLNGLVGFYVEDNQLKGLPREIGKLARLSIFYVNNNQLETIPKEIKQLTQLSTFKMDNNSSLKGNIPKELKQTSVEAIRRETEPYL